MEEVNFYSVILEGWSEVFKCNLTTTYECVEDKNLKLLIPFLEHGDYSRITIEHEFGEEKKHDRR